jgi:hypothetical protein
VVALADDDYMPYEIAAKAGGHINDVMELLRGLHKQTSRKYLKNPAKTIRPLKPDTRPEHKDQLKLF